MRGPANRITGGLLALVMLVSLLPARALAENENAAGWSGSADTAWYEENAEAASFEIGSAAELAGLAQLVNAGNSFSGKTVALTADIDLEGREWTPIGGGGTGGQFRGDFDGHGHTISNLKITRGLSYTAENKGIGLFGATQEGEIRNFTLRNADVTGSGYVAAVVGGDAFLESKITDVHVTGSVRISGFWYAGGILGNGYTSVTGCSVEGDGADTSYVQITGGYAGGIVGFMGEGNCVTAGCTVKNITVAGAYNGIGGVNGILHYGNTIRDCTVENVAVWQTTGPDAENESRIYCGAFAGTYLDNDGKNPPTLQNCEFSGRLYSGEDKSDILEPSRYVGSLWYGAQPPATVNMENCTIHMPPAAQVGGETYATLAQAFEAAKSGADKTVTLLADVSAADWSTITGLAGITVEGSGHVLTLDKQAFSSDGGNTFRNLTIDLSGASGGCALNAGPGDTFTDVSVKGNGGVLCGILVGGSDADGETVTIDGCTFDGMTYAIHHSESGDVENLVVKNSTFTGGVRVTFRSPNGQFTGNTLDGGGLDIMGGAQTVTGNTFRNGSRISFHLEGSVFENNTIRSGSYLEFTGADGQSRDLRSNDFGEQIIVTTEVDSAAITLPSSAKSGSVFAGWSHGEETFQAGDCYPVTENVTLTARWTAKPSGGSTSGDKTETTTNPDGSTTTTVTRPNGTVTETTTDTAGNKTETVTNPDGSSATTVTNADGSSSATTVDQTGRVESAVKLPANLVEDAQEKGQAVSLPMPAVPVTADKSAAPTVTVSLPAGSSARVEVPVANVTPGTVAVMVKADGTEEIIRTSVTTGSGVALTLEDGATVKIVDNSKSFADVADDHWGADAVAFASSRELLAGTSPTTFAPETHMTRAMVVTALARYVGVDTSAGDTWYDAGARWAMSMGISDGTDLKSSVTREQLVTMLYRCAGQPAVSGDASAFADGHAVSAYAADAMAWAIEKGLIAGVGNNTLSPQGAATRAQVAAILMRFAAAMG